MKRLQLSTAFCFTMFLFGAMAGSAGAKSEGYKKISAPEVKNLIEERKAVVVNLLSQIEYEIQHIPGSINIPVIDMETTDNLPKEKDIPLVFYCMGKR